jgi:hypothetical protein
VTDSLDDIEEVTHYTWEDIQLDSYLNELRHELEVLAS